MRAPAASETISTLRFGERTQLIKNQPKINAELSFAEMKALLKANESTIAKQAATIKQLENEIKIMQQVQVYEQFRLAAMGSAQKPVNPRASQISLAATA